MSNTKNTLRRDSLLLYVAVAFIAGFLSGGAFAVFKISPTESPGAPSQQTNMTEQQNQAIAHLEEEVTANPERFQAWTQLANLYFDTGQYHKAVGAYETSLELHSGNANIWTDLGVMYRRTDQPEKAIQAFNKAIEMDPSHEISRLNKGIVLMYDLNDPQAAVASWESLLALNPDATSSSGEPIRKFVEQVKAELAQKE